MNGPNQTRTCTITGTLTVLLANIHSADLAKTALLAAIGAISSFLVSQLLKKVAKLVCKKPHDQ
jgi:hypothetical protein